MEKAVPANPHALTPATDKVPPTKVASYLRRIYKPSAFVDNTVVPPGRVQRKRTGVLCDADAAGIVTVYVIVSLIHGVKVPVRAVWAVGFGPT